MTTLHSSQTPVHVQYRNGTYYGQISSDHKRNGKGMLILDTSTVLFAQWKDNVIQGLYVYLTDGIRAYGTMVNGKLDGYNIISTTTSYTGNGQTGQYSNTLQNNNIRTFYGTFRSQKLYGKCILIENDTVLICQYSNNQMQQVNTRKSLRQRQLYDLLKQNFTHHLYTLDQYLTKFIKTFISELEQLQEISRYEPCINYFSNESDQKFFGFQQVNKPNKKFGIILRDNQLISVGQHNNNLLQGIGRLYERDLILDGAFRNGKVQGIGISYSRSNNKFVLQVHDGAEDRVQKGFGFPLRQILQFRKEFHLRSIFFYNDMAILNLKVKFQGLIGHIFVGPRRSTLQTKQPRDYRESDRDRKYGGSSRSGSKRIQNSPLRQRLSRYELQSDIIQDNSPIKNRPNQYRPIDRASGYFKDNYSQKKGNNYQRQDDRYNERQDGRFSRTGVTEHYQQASNQSRRFAQTHQSNRSQQKNQRFSQNRSKNKFQQRQYRQQQTYNQILRQNSPYKQPNPSHSRASRTQSNYDPRQQQQRYVQQQSYNNNNNNRGRKDTRDLVKQLQNQQKGRRLALDQIYSKSNLYGRSKR